LRAGSSSSTRPAETSQTKQKMRLPSEEERDEGERARQVAKEEKRKATEDNPILTEYYRHRTSVPLPLPLARILLHGQADPNTEPKFCVLTHGRPLFRDESSRRSEPYDPWPSQWRQVHSCIPPCPCTDLPPVGCKSYLVADLIKRPVVARKGLWSGLSCRVDDALTLAFRPLLRTDAKGISGPSLLSTCISFET
jgi:hypothetical protein